MNRRALAPHRRRSAFRSVNQLNMAFSHWTIGPRPRRTLSPPPLRASRRAQAAYDEIYEVRKKRASQPRGGRIMAKQDTESSVYSVTEIIGTSPNSWEDAAKNAVEIAANSLRDLRVAEVCKLDMRVDDGKVVEYRARVSLSFKYET